MKKSLKHDLSGQTFGRLTVIVYVSKGEWLCRCTCGNEKKIAAHSLMKGSSQSCGCYNKECIGKRRKTHGLTESPEYKVWCGIKRRCLNPHDKAYPRYGARGIAICQRWQESFEAFIADMGERPSDLYSIERIDNTKDYMPGNCRWATKSEQARNRHTNRLVTWQGVTKTAQEWSAVLHIQVSTLLHRLNHQWPVEQALTTPVIHGRNRRPKT